MLNGKSSISLRRQDLAGSLEPAAGFKNLAFYHKATLGDTGINLAALNLPSEVTGWTNPSSAEMSAANLLTFKKNLILVSSSKGPLMPELSYKVGSDTQINFTESFGTAEDGEIFWGIISNTVRSSSMVADTDSMIASGSLAAGQTDISIGRAFQTNYNSSQQVGLVMVFVDGQLMFRNVSNATAAPSADGDYQELDNGSGQFTVVRLNISDAVNARPYVVMSTVLSTIKPDGSIMDVIQAQQGTIDTLVSFVALLSGVPEASIQANPSQPQLAQFGQRVVALETPTLMSDELATKLGHKIYSHGTNYNGGNSPTITLASGGGTLSSVDDSMFIPYQMQDGSWRMKFNVAVTLSSTSRTGANLAVAGLTFATTNSLAITATSATTAADIAIQRANGSQLSITHASQSTTSYRYSGDIPLEAKPTWAY